MENVAEIWMEPLTPALSEFQVDDVCWICLEGADGEEGGDGNRLARMPCACPRFAHRRCVARWQLQSAGTRKETNCEFCDRLLPDWKKAFMPEKPVANVPATMSVCVGGLKATFEVEPGPEGYIAFENKLRTNFGIPAEFKLDVGFVCRDPMTQAKITLTGERAYDAAVFCAWLSAIRRRTSVSEAKSSPTDNKRSAEVPKAVPAQPRGVMERISTLLADLRCRRIDAVA